MLDQVALLNFSLIFSGEKLSDGKGLRGKGWLTLSRIDAIPNLLGKAIREKANPTKVTK